MAGRTVTLPPHDGGAAEEHLPFGSPARERRSHGAVLTAYRHVQTKPEASDERAARKRPTSSRTTLPADTASIRSIEGVCSAHGCAAPSRRRRRNLSVHGFAGAFAAVRGGRFPRHSSFLAPAAAFPPPGGPTCGANSSVRPAAAMNTSRIKSRPVETCSGRSATCAPANRVVAVAIDGQVTYANGARAGTANRRKRGS